MSGQPGRGSEKIDVRVVREEETSHGWRYELEVEQGGAHRTHYVDLAWVDHDHWSGGAIPPSVVVERLIRLLLELQPDVDLPTRFDAATCRRLEPRLEDMLPGRL